MQYLADQKPESGLAPKNGTLERYRVQEWLNDITKREPQVVLPPLRESLLRILR